MSVEPGNRALVATMREVEASRARGEATVPTTLASEKATNPFLRAASADSRAATEVDHDDVQVFACTRELKDSFKAG